ncbi:MAG: ribonuclease J [Patescibacteria group bacterium]|nr:ribonuclease J [Patescibacteria group bacterium]
MHRKSLTRQNQPIGDSVKKIQINNPPAKLKIRKLIPKEIREEKKNHIRFATLGGLEEIGRNMSFFEYKDEIVIIDAGLEFPDADTPGVDYLIPNVGYLEARKKNIKGLIITHAHFDHIGAIPYIIEKLGNPTIYTTNLAKEIIKKRQGEFPNSSKLDFEIVKNHDRIKISENFEVEFFNIIHSIPDTVSVLLKTSAGNFVYCTDVKFDYHENGSPIGFEEFEWVSKLNIHTLFLESTNAESTGNSTPEKIVEKNIEEIFKKASGRIFIGIFASLLTRIEEIIKIAEKHNRKVAISGLSMKTNVQIAQNLGYMKIKKGTIIPLEDVNKYRDEKILILSTGAQGEPNASLVKIANGEHRFVQVKHGDTIIFSSSIIPGNEKSVQTLKDNLCRLGAKIFHSKLVDLHASGHATGDELKKIVKIIKPKFYLPIHGQFFMRSVSCELASEVGVPKENCLLPDNGQVVEMTENNAKLTNELIPAYYIMVDGLGVGDVGEIVMRDRRVLSNEGMVVIIATLDRRNGRFLKNPDIISRGFIYLKENKELVEDLRKKIKGVISRIPVHQSMESDYIKSLIRDQIGQFLYNKTKRRPMVLPVVIQV